jgi:molybdopterin-binding protein
MKYTVPNKFQGVIKEIVASGAEATVIFELHGGSTEITVSLPANAVSMMRLKKGWGAGVVIIVPISGIQYNSGQRLATIKVDKKWVTIPYGPLAPVGNPMDAGKLSGDDLAHLYGYENLDAFRQVTSAVPGTGCAPGSVLFQIETVLEHETWVSFPSGPNCEARINTMRDQQKNNKSNDEAWLHRYLNPDEYNNARAPNANNAFRDNVPVLAGFSYDGSDQKPELFSPAGASIGRNTTPRTVNSYIGIQKICQIQITKIKQKTAL